MNGLGVSATGLDTLKCTHKDKDQGSKAGRRREMKRERTRRRERRSKQVETSDGFSHVASQATQQRQKLTRSMNMLPWKPLPPSLSMELKICTYKVYVQMRLLCYWGAICQLEQQCVICVLKHLWWLSEAGKKWTLNCCLTHTFKMQHSIVLPPAAMVSLVCRQGNRRQYNYWQPRRREGG